MGLQSKILWQFSVPLPDLQVEKSVMGPRTLLTVEEFLWYNCSAVCGHLPRGSTVGLTVTSSKRAYATGCVTQVAAPRAPAPAAGHCWPVPPRETQHRSASVSVGSLDPGVHKVLFEPSEHLCLVWGLILNVILPLLPSCWGFSFALGCGISFFWWDPAFSFDGCSAVRCDFGVVAGDEHTSFYSTILRAHSF